MTTHEIDELKKAILHIAKTDPDFFADLIGEVVKDNLHIKEQERDFYAPHDFMGQPGIVVGGRRRVNPTPSATPKYCFGSANRLATKTVLKTAEWETAL